MNQPREFPGPWRDDGPEFFPIAAALAQHSMAGFGEFYFRLSITTPGKALVYGTGDGVNWNRAVVNYTSTPPLARVADLVDELPDPPY
jgi:hypothetical protein